MLNYTDVAIIKGHIHTVLIFRLYRFVILYIKNKSIYLKYVTHNRTNVTQQVQARSPLKKRKKKRIFHIRRNKALRHTSL
jgi:hypothetical protein